MLLGDKISLAPHGNKVYPFEKTRNRFTYALLILLVMGMGLCSRHFARILPEWNKAYLGDILWAWMIFLMIGWILRKKPSCHVATLAFLFSYGIEGSQLYHAPWIDGIRATSLGALILGNTFVWSDLVCYLSGITAGMVLERYCLKYSFFPLSRKLLLKLLLL